MGIYYESDRRRWVVRWTEDGKRRVRRFADEAEAREFAASVGPPGRRRARDGSPYGQLAAVGALAYIAAVALLRARG